MNGDALSLERMREWFPTPGHLVLFFRIGFWLYIMPILLKYMSMTALMRLITPGTRTLGPDGEEHAETLREKGDLIHAYATRILRENPDNMGKMCLKRSLVTYRFLRLRGIAAEFKLGVRKNGEGDLVGHSWIEVGGELFHDEESRRFKYAVTFSYPGKDPESRPARREA